MIEKLFDKPEIYRVFVELPQNPLMILLTMIMKQQQHLLHVLRQVTQ